MKTPTLFLPNIPMVGISGQRDNVAALLEATGLLMPPGMVVVATIGHDSACPCVDGTAALTRCLCEHVNVTIEMQATR